MLIGARVCIDVSCALVGLRSVMEVMGGTVSTVVSTTVSDFECARLEVINWDLSFGVRIEVSKMLLDSISLIVGIDFVIMTLLRISTDLVAFGNKLPMFENWSVPDSDNLSLIMVDICRLESEAE